MASGVACPPQGRSVQYVLVVVQYEKASCYSIFQRTVSFVFSVWMPGAVAPPSARPSVKLILDAILTSQRVAHKCVPIRS